MIVHAVTNPESFIADRLAALKDAAEVRQCFALEYAYCQYYLPERPEITLMALVMLEHMDGSCVIHAGLSAASATLREKFHRFDSASCMATFAAECGLPWLNLSRPLLLKPVYIPKPWGQEIWYTGIEIRGQSAVTDRQHSVPLPWLLSLMPGFLAAYQAQHIILLKVLDPLPDDIFGDLYFELHEQKQEVYIVTHIDSHAWPDDTGGIRLGFNQKKRAEFADDDAFKAAYLDAVRAYESVRREIDRQLDQQRFANRIGLTDPVDATTLQDWLQAVSSELLAAECDRRAEMHSFTAVQPLQVGDVVKVPCYMPHALQHGVRTVEFQTPVYERKILSFAQKVLTQKHWDTESALDGVILDAPGDTVLNSIYADDGIVVEQVVAFSDFEVQRIRVSPHCHYSLPICSDYRVLMIISGGLVWYATEHPDLTLAEYSHHRYLSGQAVFLPASLPVGCWCADKEGAILLLAVPVNNTDKCAGTLDVQQ